MTPNQRRGVRFHPETGWEMRCDSCAADGRGQRYWPIDHEFWDHEHGLSKCRACHNADARRRRRKSAGYRAYLTEKKRAYGREWARAKRRQQREERMAA